MKLKHKVLPRSTQPCFCSHPRKDHVGEWCNWCWEVWRACGPGMRNADAKHNFVVDNFKYIEVLLDYNKTGVIQYET